MYTLTVLITLFIGTVFIEDMDGPYDTESQCKAIGEEIVAAEYGKPLNYQIMCEKDDPNLTVYPGR